MAERERVTRALMPPSSAPDGSLAAELQRAIARRGVSVHWLQRALAEGGVRIDPATLISWRTGRLVPGPEARQAVALLEEVLGLPAEHLTSRVPASRQRGQFRSNRDHTRPVATRSTVSPAIQRALDALGFEGPASLAESRVSVHLEVDQHGAQRRVTRRSTWVARRDGAQSFPVVTALSEPGAGRPALTLVAGCSEGPHYADLAEGVFATAVMLDHPLRAGETAETEHCISLPAGLPADASFEHQLREQVDEVSLTIEFHPDRVPSAAYAYSTSGPDGPETTWSLPVLCTLVTHTLNDFGPGGLGVRWRW